MSLLPLARPITPGIKKGIKTGNMNSRNYLDIQGIIWIIQTIVCIQKSVYRYTKKWIQVY